MPPERADPARTLTTLGPRLWIVAAAVLMSTGGAGIKAVDLPPVAIAALRSAVAALVFFAASRARWSTHGPTASVAAVYAAMTLLYVVANRFTTAANTIFLQSTAPLYVALAAPLVLGERISGRDLLYMLAVAAGLSLVFLDIHDPSATAPHPFAGDLLATLGGVAWAGTIMGLRLLSSDPVHGRSPMPALLLGNLAVVVLGAPALLRHGLPSLHDLVIVTYLGCFQVALAYLLFNRGVREVPAFEASLLLLLEPVLNPLWAWLVHGEAAGAWTLAGGAAIVSSTALKILIDAHRLRPARQPLARPRIGDTG